MSTEPVLDAEAGQNLFNQMMELYWDDALEDRGLSLNEVWALQVVFLNPFKGGQYPGLRGEDNDFEVRVNEEVEVVALVENDSGGPIEAGDPVKRSDIGAVKGIKQVPDFGPDVGHVTFIRVNIGEFHGAFDFVYNKSYVGPLVSAAGEFLEAASKARDNEHWRAFVENAIHAAERHMKATVIRHGQPAYNHDTVESSYEMFVGAPPINQELLETYRELTKLRYAATYVDPGDHPRGVDEIDFELDGNQADTWLRVITDHHESVTE